MTFRNWRYSEERLNHIIEKSPGAVADFNKALRSIPQLAALKEPIETAVESMTEMARDLLAAREYLKDTDTENERLQARVEKLEGMIGVVHVINNQAPAPSTRPWQGEPIFATPGTGTPPIDAGITHGNSAAGNLS